MLKSLFSGATLVLNSMGLSGDDSWLITAKVTIHLDLDSIRRQL